MKHRSAWMAGIVGVVAAALIALFASAGTDSDPLAVDTNQLIGKRAPAIEAKDTQGRPFRTVDYRGRWLLVNFFATWCSPCVAEHPELEAFSSEHSASGDAAVVSVAYNDEPQAVSDFFARHGGDWAVIADDKSDFSIEYAVVGLPESYLIDPGGIVRHKFLGGITAATVDREMRRKR